MLAPVRYETRTLGQRETGLAGSRSHPPRDNSLHLPGTLAN